MATVYTNDLRLADMAQGENDGTWGDKTDTNFALIGEAFGYGTTAFAADSDETFTVADGSTDPVRAMYIKFTSGGSLSATRTATLAPNTMNRVWIIENATTGGQSIEIKQGSGSTVTIGTGETRIVYADGGGSGAAVTEAVISGYPTTIDNTTLSAQADHEVSWSATYKRVEVELRNVIPATDAVNPVFKTSTDAGSTYHETSTSYKNGATEAASITATLNVGSAANEIGVCGFINIYAPADATYHIVNWKLNYIDSSGDVQESTDTWAVQHAEDITGLKLEFSSGNLESGSVITKGYTS